MNIDLTTHTAVAVYGTLKMGFRNHGLMERAGAVPLATTLTKVPFMLNDGHGFPFVYPMGCVTTMAPRVSIGRLMVEVYAVPIENLKILDGLESYDPDDPAGSMYIRIPVEVEYTDELTGMNYVQMYVSTVPDSFRPNSVPSEHLSWRYIEDWDGPYFSWGLRDEDTEAASATAGYMNEPFEIDAFDNDDEELWIWEQEHGEE